MEKAAGGKFSSFASEADDYAEFASNNPKPIVWAEADLIVSDYLSPAKLKELAASDDLNDVTILEMHVDTSETSLGNFGQYLPQLVQLKLSDSLIPSVRDIGTSLRNLRVIWLSRCALKDVDGIASLPGLKELYVSFNNIEDASPISFLDELEVLDLEANKISDVGQLDYLCMMTELNTLTLTNNQVTQLPNDEFGGPTYREYVLTKLPNLLVLDDENRSKQNIVSSSDISSRNDVDIITAAIKDGLLSEADASIISKADEEHFKIGSDVLPSSFFEATPMKRPSTSRRIRRTESTVASLSLEQDTSLQDDSSSSLTFGDPHCGNPINLLRTRRKTGGADRRNDDDFMVNPKLLTRPTTALGIQHEIDHLSLDDEGTSYNELEDPIPTHEEHKVEVGLKLEDASTSEDDDVLFTHVKHSPRYHDFDAAHPPDFLKSLKQSVAPKNLPMRALPPSTSKLKPFYHHHHDLQPPRHISPRRGASASSHQLPKILPNPPLRRPQTSSGPPNNSRVWQYKEPIIRDASSLKHSTVPSKFLMRKELPKKLSMQPLKASVGDQL